MNTLFMKFISSFYLDTYTPQHTLVITYRAQHIFIVMFQTQLALDIRCNIFIIRVVLIFISNSNHVSWYLLKRFTVCIICATYFEDHTLETHNLKEETSVRICYKPFMKDRDEDQNNFDDTIIFLR